MDCPEPFHLDDDGRCRYAVGVRVFDEKGHVLDGDFDPKGHHGCRHTKHRQRKVKEIMEEVQPALAPAAEAAHKVDAPSTTSHVGMADALPFDLTKVLPADGMLSTPAVILGGLAIIGGVALKVVPAWFRSRAEMATQRLALKARRLELEQKAKDAEQNNGTCEARHAACAASVAAVVERVKLVEAQVDMLSGSVAGARDDATKLALQSGREDARIDALEQRVKALSESVEGNKTNETST